MAAVDEKARTSMLLALAPSALHLERVNPVRNEARLYLLSWTPTLFGWGLLRRYGCIGHWQRVMPPLPFDSPDEAWPLGTGAGCDIGVTLRVHIERAVGGS